MPANADKKTYYVSVAHRLIQDVRNDSNEFEVYLNDAELTELQDRMTALEQDDKYAFKRAAVPYKSADRDDGIRQYDDATIALYQYLRDHGSEESIRLIDGMGVLPKLEHTGYEDKGYGDGSPTNK
ncbi:hypothetical protein ACE6ED_16700 [Paenibacillus sp. CN-4]|uniref:hypothetical protein n=1 Tax=Paenibacillus nanchangensis TaxID=3348343 RepID=UPI00397E2F10